MRLAAALPGIASIADFAVPCLKRLDAALCMVSLQSGLFMAVLRRIECLLGSHNPCSLAQLSKADTPFIVLLFDIWEPVSMWIPVAASLALLYC